MPRMSKVAVIKTGGKQYIVEEGDVVKIEKIAGKEGEKVSFDEVLFVDDGSKAALGTPTVKAAVSGEVLEQGRAQKVTVIRYRAKSRYFKKNGHRQPFTKVKITGIK